MSGWFWGEREEELTGGGDAGRFDVEDFWG